MSTGYNAQAYFRDHPNYHESLHAVMTKDHSVGVKSLEDSIQRTNALKPFRLKIHIAHMGGCYLEVERLKYLSVDGVGNKFKVFQSVWELRVYWHKWINSQKIPV